MNDGRKPLSKSYEVCMTFARRSYAQAACEYLRRQGFHCLPIEKVDMGYVLGCVGFIESSPVLPTALQHALEEFYATEIEVYPINARLDYQNYSHTLYYNDYEQMDTALGYVIDEHIDKRVMVFDNSKNGAYAWKVVFCTREEIAQEHKDRIIATVHPGAWLFNEPVGDVSPTSIFK